MKIGDVEIEVKVVHDIAELDHDAIVNAANAKLLPGAGVCGAIYKKGGAQIFQECDTYLKAIGKKSLQEGQVMITGGGNLKAKHVIHAVGPIWKGTSSEEETLDRENLYMAYANSLRCASEQGLTSIAFPSISTGIYGFPVEQAAPIALQAIVDFVNQTPRCSIKWITLALWPDTFSYYEKALKKYF